MVKMSEYRYFFVLALVAQIFTALLATEPFARTKVNFIKRHYEHRLFSKRHLFFGNNNATSMMIFFTTGDEDQYVNWEWFWQDKQQWGKTAYLFIEDEQNSWFLGKNNNKSVDNYSSLIAHYITKLGLAYDKVIAVGGSMGGYGALFYATLLGFQGALVINPDVHEHTLGANKLKNKVGNNWKNLDAILDEHPYKVHVSLAFGQKAAEQDGGYALLDRLQRKNITTVIRRYQPYKKNDAESFKKFLEEEVDYLLSQQSGITSRIVDEEIDELFPDETRSSVYRFPMEKMAYIKDHYECTLFDQQHLFYPAKNAKRLLIFFTGAVKNRYSMWSWFWRDDEAWQDTAYLFVKDDSLCWYLGNNERSLVEDYKELIAYYMWQTGVSRDAVYTIGASMGGYGALFYATALGFKGAIVLNPQVTKAYASHFSIDNTQDRWLNLDEHITLASTVPHLSLVACLEKSDQLAGYTLIDTYKAKLATMIIRRDQSILHTGSSVFTKSFIEREVAFFEQQMR